MKAEMRRGTEGGGGVRIKRFLIILNSSIE
jgi:hypothetical protein